MGRQDELNKDSKAEVLAEAIAGPLTASAKLKAIALFLAFAVAATLLYVTLGGAQEDKCRRACLERGQDYLFASPLTLAWRGAGVNSQQCTCTGTVPPQGGRR